MPQVRRFDHVGLTVADLDVVTAFFVALGLEVEGRTFVEGEFLDTVCGIPGSRTEIVMLKPPGDGTRLELSSFVRPDSVPGSPAAMANELGLRNVAFEVNDLQAAVDWAATEGYGLVGGIGEYEGAWRMAYVRGPEGIIVSLAERIGLSLARLHLPQTGCRPERCPRPVQIPGPAGKYTVRSRDRGRGRHRPAPDRLLTRDRRPAPSAGDQHPGMSGLHALRRCVLAEGFGPGAGFAVVTAARRTRGRWCPCDRSRTG